MSQERNLEAAKQKAIDELPPNASRYKPLRRERGPDLSDHDPRVDALVKDAQTRGSLMKHDLRVWRLKGNWGELRCAKCEGTVGVALHPPPGGDPVAGRPLREFCR